ncbi:BnaA08g03110D [Brassica napus]|uniref:BnaA08g03110D protein n=1 Tax=Brassica napus TaxID=3708 RepID=A0A078FTX4_BRANA|nr:BnaA08g03110D [Brassica napus]
MNDHKNLLQGGMQEENRAKKPISVSPTSLLKRIG